MLQAFQHTRRGGASALVGGAFVSAALGSLLALGGWLMVDAAAGLGALVGTLGVVVIAAGGTMVVDAVAGMLPGASLLVALLTYTFQLMLVLLGFVALERSGWLGPVLDRQWVGGAAIVVTLAWLGTQLTLAVRARIPTYVQSPPEPPLAGRAGWSDEPEGGAERP